MKTIQANNNKDLKVNVETKSSSNGDKQYYKLNAYLNRISKNLNLSYVAMMK